MQPHRPRRDDQLQVVFVFVILYAGILSVLRPDPTPRQVGFRLGMVLVGIVGLLAVHAWKRRR